MYRVRKPFALISKNYGLLSVPNLYHNPNRIFFQIKAFTDKDKDTTLSPTSFEQVEEAEFVLMIRMRCVCL